MCTICAVLPLALLERALLQRARQDRGRRGEVQPDDGRDRPSLDLASQSDEARVWGRGAHRGVEREAYRTGLFFIFFWRFSYGERRVLMTDPCTTEFSRPREGTSA